MKIKLKAIIIDRGYNSVFDFCEKNELNYRQVNRIVNNEVKSINAKLLIKICRILDCEISDLIYIEK